MSRFTRTRETQADLIRHFLSLKDAQLEEFTIVKIIRYTHAEKPVVVMFFDRRKAREHHFNFPTLEAREIYIDKIKAQLLERKAKQEAKNEAILNKINAYKVGDIFYSSWGYEQTNIDFYIVTKIVKSTYTLRGIAQNRKYDVRFNDRGTCTPNEKYFVGEPFEKRLTKNGGFILSSYQWASLYDGKEKYWSSYA